jgi:hypothetical protein
VIFRPPGRFWWHGIAPIAGFLLGAPKDSPVWGSNVWVDAAGHAAAEPELVRDLYGLAAAQWVGESRRAQYVLVPASDEGLLRAWYRLGFGRQQAHAVRPLPDETPVPPPKVAVRRARRDDLPALAGLEAEVPRQHSLAPVFSASPVPSYEECLAGSARIGPHMPVTSAGTPTRRYCRLLRENGGRAAVTVGGCSCGLPGGPAPGGFYSSMAPPVRRRCCRKV